MGLFWSMLPSPGQHKGIRFMKSDVDTPVEVKLSLYSGFLDIPAMNNKIPMVTTTIERWYKASNVERITVRVGRTRGVLLKPKGKV